MVGRGLLALAVCAMASSAASAQTFTLTSPDLATGGAMAEAQAFDGLSCRGGNVSPALEWSGPPKAAKSFALTVDDPDAPVAGGFWHWVVFDIPRSAKGLAGGAGDPRLVAPMGAVQIRNDYGSRGYGGPCPPPGDPPHRYRFTLYALDTPTLGVAADATVAAARALLQRHTLARAVIVGIYGR